MNDQEMQARTIEAARREAEAHRQEIARRIEALGDRIGQTVESAQQARERVRDRLEDLEGRARRSVDWMRANPWRAVGLALATGFYLAGRPEPRERKRRATRLEPDITVRELRMAYRQGRRDERAGQRARERRPGWRDLPRYRARTLPVRNVLDDLSTFLLGLFAPLASRVRLSPRRWWKLLRR